MIFYGRRASRIKDGRISNISCPDCDTQTSYNYSIFGKYAHVYWIPLFPMGKESVLECNNCKRTYKASDLPQKIQQKFHNDKQDAKTPIWNFAGIGVIAFLISLGAYWSKQDDENNNKFINDPQIGDVYSIKGSTPGHYTAAKVTNITNDSIHLIFSDYEVDKRSAINKVDKDEYYTTATDGYTKQEIVSLFSEGTIYDVDRD